MKNILCLLVGLGCVAAWYYTRPEPAPAPAPAPVAALVAAPTPRAYYHSPLDAPAMSVSDHTNLGYFDGTPGGFNAVYSSNTRLGGASSGGATVSLGGYTLDTATGARTGSGLNATAGYRSAPTQARPAQTDAAESRRVRTLPARLSSVTAAAVRAEEVAGQ